MEGSYQKCDRDNGHFMQRDGCSHKYKDMKQPGQFRERQVNKVWLEQRSHRKKYQVSKGYTLMGHVCLARTPELILKEIWTLGLLESTSRQKQPLNTFERKSLATLNN